MFPVILPALSWLVLFPALAPRTLKGPQEHCLSARPENVIPWPVSANPPLGEAAEFERVVVGKLLDGVDADAACLAGGVVTVLFQPQGCAAILPVPTLDDVDDIAVLPAAVGKDSLLATDARGLLRVRTSAAETISFEAPEEIEGVDWVHAAPIHVVDLDGAGGLDVLGLKADGATVLALRASGSGFTANPPFTAPAPVIDLLACNWDEEESSDVEIVVLTQSGLHVYEQSGGSPIFSRSYSAASGVLEVVQLTPSDTVCAWGFPVGTGPWRLLLLDGDMAQLPSPLTLTFDLCTTTLSPHPIALVAGDYNENGGEDLLVAYEENRTGVVLRNMGGTVPFRPYDTGAYDVFSLDLPNTALGGLGIPAFAQVDANGPEDFVFPAKWGEVEVSLSFAYWGEPAGAPAPPNSADIARASTKYVPETPHSKLAFHFTQVSAYPERSHLEIRAWKRPPPAGSEWYLDEDAVGHWMVMLADSDEDDIHRVDLQCPQSGFLPSGSVWPDVRHYYLDFRFLNYGSQPLAASPWYQGGFFVSTSENGPTEDEREALVDQPGVIATSYFELWTALSGGDGTLVGGYVSMTQLPPFRPGDVPNPNYYELQFPTSTVVGN